MHRRRQRALKIDFAFLYAKSIFDFEIIFILKLLTTK